MRSRLLMLLLLLIVIATGSPLMGEDAVHLARWQDDRAGAIALTFDDGSSEQALVAVPLLDALGLKATFAINPGKTPANGDGRFGYATWDQWRAIAQNGHEIANHSMTHPNFSQVNDAAVLETEIVAAQRLIEKELGAPCVSFVYPFNAETEAARTLVRKTHLAWSGGERKTYGGPDFTAAKANAWVDEAIAKKSLMVAMIHGITRGYLPFSGAAVFQEHLDYLKAKSTQVWVAPLGTIKRYEAERDAARLDVQVSGKKMVITLTCALDPVSYNVPLTVVILSGKAKTVSAKRAGTGKVTASIAGERIFCEIVPGPGAVTITWK